MKDVNSKELLIFWIWIIGSSSFDLGNVIVQGSVACISKEKKKDISLNIFKWMELINDKWQFVYYQLIIGDIAQFHSLREGLRLPS